MDAASGTLTDDELADEITAWAGRVAAGEAHLLELIGEFDEREAWGAVGVLSCAHWLTWKLGMGEGAARERVRVARAVRSLPLTAAAFGAGRLSWTQVRAISRVATPADEQTFVELARHCTGAQLETLVRGVRRARKPAEDAADPEQAAWKLRPRVSYDQDGTLVITVRVPAEQGPVVLAGLERMQAEVQAELDATATAAADVPAGTSPASRPIKSADAEPVPAEPLPAGPLPSHPLLGAPIPIFDPLSPAQQAAVDAWTAECARVPAGTSTTPAAGPAPAPMPVPVPVKATLTDALVRLAERALESPSPVRTHKSRLKVQIDPLSGWARTTDGELLPPVSLKDVLETLPGRGRLRRLRAEDLTALDTGRSARHPSDGLRELLGTLDGERCRFPGCTRTTNLHAHHVQYWSDEGRTDLANLVLVCSRHHTLIHAHGFGLTLHPDRSLTVTTAEGVPVLHHPALPWRPAEELDPEHDVSAGTLPPHWNGDRLDLDHAVWVLLQHAA